MTYKIKFKNYPGLSALYPILLLLFMLAGGFRAQAQQPMYLAHPDNTYKILQLETNSQSNGTPIVLGGRNDGNTSNKARQEWYYDAPTNTIRLKANPNKCLARKGQPLPNDPIVLADYSPNNESQRWVLEDHKIKFFADKSLCIGLANYNFNQGNTAVLQEIFSVGNYQKWFLRNIATTIMTADGQLHRVNSPGDTYVEYSIPDPCPYQFLNITSRGGDGGFRSVKNIITKNEDIKARGGEGATAWGLFKIGAGAGELKPGTTFRFVIGRAGASRRNDAISGGGGGGGGTGVIYEVPGEKKGGFYYPWEMLLVAGGGGGAYADAAAVHSDGKPGADGADPGNGLQELGSVNVGGGFRADSDPVTIATWPNDGNNGPYPNKETAGFKVIDDLVFPTGGTNAPASGNKPGGFGFGAGGAAEGSGGGGGGYTGEGPLHRFWGGDGGTSYVNSGWTESGGSKKNGVTANSADGYVEYLFTNDGPVSRDLYFECHKGTEVQVLKTGAWTLLWQYDGNLVLYGSGFPNGAWASNTAGTDLIFQGDGNLVIYQANAGPWSTDTPNDHHDGKGGRKLVLTPDGSLFITDQDGKVIWTGR